MTAADRVLEALATVRDPELDEPITALGFVASCSVSDDGDVAVQLRLPTSQCAPNFAYLMVADARAAVRRLPGVRSASVLLDDHMTAAEINDAVGRGDGFAGAFPGETAGGLDELRSLFRRKALVARQSRLAEALVRAGAGADEIVALRVRDLAPGADARRCVELRGELGLDAGPEAPAIVRPDGRALARSELSRWLRAARLVALSLEGNAGLCRALLARRHAIPDPEEVTA